MQTTDHYSNDIVHTVHYPANLPSKYIPLKTLSQYYSSRNSKLNFHPYIKPNLICTNKIISSYMLFIQPSLPRQHYYYYSLSQQPFSTATVVTNTVTQYIGSENSHFLPRCIFTNSIRRNVPGRGLQHRPQYHHSPSLQ